jgi:hypothetical protein
MSATGTSAPRLALRPTEAAKACGVSDESFARYCRPHLKCVRVGSLVLYRPAEIERFLIERESSPIEDVAR